MISQEYTTPKLHRMRLNFIKSTNLINLKEQKEPTYLSTTSSICTIGIIPKPKCEKPKFNSERLEMPQVDTPIETEREDSERSGNTLTKSIADLMRSLTILKKYARSSKDKEDFLRNKFSSTNHSQRDHGYNNASSKRKLQIKFTQEYLMKSLS